MSDIRLYTPVEPIRGVCGISRNDRITMLGSCFTDNIGECLRRDGFDVQANPLGVLFNPASIASIMRRALDSRDFTHDDLVFYDGRWRCLYLNTRYSDTDADALLERLNDDIRALGKRLASDSVWIITFGTAWVYTYKTGDYIVGNCHKIPQNAFERTRLDIDTIVGDWKELCQGKRVIFTVSPVRHLADGLHGNNLSKAVLHLATERIVAECPSAEYFPTFEIVCDQLRDYRFYDRDLKHPSPTAIDIVYDFFANTYFDKDTQQRAMQYRAESLRALHRPIIEQ